jgi:hypothetical protein
MRNLNSAIDAVLTKSSLVARSTFEEAVPIRRNDQADNGDVSAGFIEAILCQQQLARLGLLTVVRHDPDNSCRSLRHGHLAFKSSQACGKEVGHKLSLRERSRL